MTDVTGLDEAIESLDRLGKSAPVALADAINHTSNQSRIALRSEMQSVFATPTPFTLNAIAVQPAKPAGDPEGAVFVKDKKQGANAPEDWFAPQVFGGERQLKASERTLRALGVLPAGMFTVPTKGARLDKYGNMSRGHIRQLLTSIRKTVAGARKEPFFVARKGDKAIGIAERVGSGVQLVLVFTREPQYVQRLDYSAVVERVADQNIEDNLNLAITKALG